MNTGINIGIPILIFSNTEIPVLGIGPVLQALHATDGLTRHDEICKTTDIQCTAQCTHTGMTGNGMLTACLLVTGSLDSAFHTT